MEFPLAVNRARASTKRKLTPSEAKAKVVAAIRDGVGVRDAMALVDRAEDTYKDWRRNDPEFAKLVDDVREVARAARSRGTGGRTEVPDFETFCAEYLNMPMAHHHQRVWDVVQGREPRDLHPAIRHQVGRTGRLLINFPPYHGKTQQWSVNYVVYRMMVDPNVRIAIVSQTQTFAKKIIHQVKQVLELPQYAKLHAAFMPEGGWKGDSWTKTEIYLSGVEEAQKDPTLQALGLGGQIYGSRLDVVIMDDLVTSKNVHNYKELADYVGTEVASRVDDDGVLICLGTRMGSNDLYSELRDLLEWDGETPVWTWFAQPAVLEEPSRDPNTWVTLWPAKWPGPSLARARAEANTEARWQLTYQQMDASIDQVFPTGAVMASIDGRRAAGPIESLYVTLGVDPVATGYTAMVVVGVDRATERRFVLDGHNQARMPPEQLVAKIKYFIETYGVRELIVERNAFQGFLTSSADLRDFCYSHNCLLNPHYTGAQKWDENLGVSAMSMLFQSCADHDPATDEWTRRPVDRHLISLPNPKFASFVDALTTQLITWQPKEGQRQQHTLTDLVMALWMANLGIQKVLDQARNTPRHLANPFISRADARQRAVVNLHELREAQMRGVQEVSFYSGESV